jgi:hypothetical protein
MTDTMIEKATLTNLQQVQTNYDPRQSSVLSFRKKCPLAQQGMVENVIDFSLQIDLIRSSSI